MKALEALDAAMASSARPKSTSRIILFSSNWQYTWTSPLVRSRDGSIQKLAADHIEIPRGGGLVDAYLLALLEFDDNEDISPVRELMDYGLWL